MKLKKGLKILGIGFVLLILVMVVKTLLLSSKQYEENIQSKIELKEGYLERLSGAIQIETVTWAENTDTAKFTVFHQYLEEQFPLIHEKLGISKFNHHALLYKWEGLNTDLKPIVLLAHQDVVPVDEKYWDQKPFSGLNDGESIWGRGTLDDKGSLMSIMESVEILLTENFNPERTIYLAFGNDEEVMGNGAKSIAKHLKEQGAVAEFVIDEGMVITKGLVPMIDKPVALIGTSEKGYLTFELTCEIAGGHSSTPENETAISVMSNAISKLTKEPSKSRFTPPVVDFLNYLGPEVDWPVKLVFANRWLFDPIILGIYKGTNSGNALVSTTTAPTIFNAGYKDNVIPMEAKANINYRLLPGDTYESMHSYITEKLDDDRIKLKRLEPFKLPAKVSPIETWGFETIHKSIKAVYENTLVMPTLMLAGSDSRYYSEISENIYRFAPYILNGEDLEMIHGNNEKIKIEDYESMINFYYRLIKNSQE